MLIECCDGDDKGNHSAWCPTHKNETQESLRYRWIRGNVAKFIEIMGSIRATSDLSDCEIDRLIDEAVDKHCGR